MKIASAQKPEPDTDLSLAKNSGMKKRGVLSLETENIVFDSVPVGRSQVMKVGDFILVSVQGWIINLFFQGLFVG